LFTHFDIIYDICECSCISPQIYFWIPLNMGKIWLNDKSSWTFHKRIPMMLNCFGTNKLHGFMMHSVMLAVGHILHQNDYSFQFSNVGSYVYTCMHQTNKLNLRFTHSDGDFWTIPQCTSTQKLLCTHISTLIYWSQCKIICCKFQNVEDWWCFTLLFDKTRRTWIGTNDSSSYSKVIII